MNIVDEDKIPPKQYRIFLFLLKPKIYESILQLRGKMGIPDCGLNLPKVAAAVFGHTGHLLDNSPVAEVLAEHNSLFNEFLENLSKQLSLSGAQKRFAALFIFFDIQVSPIKILQSPAIDYKIAKDGQSLCLRISIPLHPKIDSNSFSNFFNEVVIPFQQGKLPNKQYRSISSERIRIYYWLVLQKLTASQFIKKFGYQGNRKLWITSINFVARDMKKTINSL